MLINKDLDSIYKIDILFTIETDEIIIGAIYIFSPIQELEFIIGKIFIYKNMSPYFIELNYDETYINYIFNDSNETFTYIYNYIINLLTVDFPGSILNIEKSYDVAFINLPKKAYS